MSHYESTKEKLARQVGLYPNPNTNTNTGGVDPGRNNQTHKSEYWVALMKIRFEPKLAGRQA